MRTFLAVVPPRETADEIHRSHAAMRDAWKGVKWIPAHQYHITLAFLGDHEGIEVEKALKEFGKVLSDFHCFHLAFSGEGRFGSACSPRLLFLKVGRGGEHLQDMLEALKPALSRYSMWEDRSYRPHLTLGRPRRRGVKGPDGGSLLLPGMKSANVASFLASEVVLFKSVLDSKGPEYSVLESWPLKED